VGIFNGKYITEVPEGYLEHLSQLRGKKGKIAVGAAEEEAGAGRAILIANSGPVDVALRQRRVSEDDGAGMNGTKSPDYQEDIRYVTSNDVLESRVLIDAFTVFTTLQASLRSMRNEDPTPYVEPGSLGRKYTPNRYLGMMKQIKIRSNRLEKRCSHLQPINSIERIGQIESRQDGSGMTFKYVRIRLLSR
jgi:hypothetical protein